MNEIIKKELMDQARQQNRGKEISFCGQAETWDECFTVEKTFIMLWFNIGADTKAIVQYF